MGRWRDGGCQEVGVEKLEECCKEQGQLSEASKEGLGSKRAVVPMVVMMMTDLSSFTVLTFSVALNTMPKVMF